MKMVGNDFIKGLVQHSLAC